MSRYDPMFSKVVAAVGRERATIALWYAGEVAGQMTIPPHLAAATIMRLLGPDFDRTELEVKAEGNSQFQADVVIRDIAMIKMAMKQLYGDSYDEVYVESQKQRMRKSWP